VNRDGNMGGVLPLYFDGAVCKFAELPLPNDNVGMTKVYSLLNKIRKTNVSMFSFRNIFKKWRTM